jgi:2'-hydroxyisoflavone reductase
LKNILILGGTGFVGRILSENLTKSDHSVTLFNRGKRNANLFPEFTKILGDRNTEDIFQIASSNWDVVIDFSGFFPDNLEIVISFLKNNAGRYIFVSSASVYDVTHPAKLKYPIKENSQILKCTPEQRVDKHPFNFYGNKKAECERILLNADWLDVIIFRPALIYGRYDPTDRFYYWLYRAKTQEKVLLPDDGITEQTNTYSEDFADVLLKAIEIEKHEKIYNAVTHPAISIKNIFLKVCESFKKNPELVNASSNFLTKNNVSEWTGIPMWIKDFSFVLDNSLLLNDFNIKFNSFEESVAQTIDYYEKLNWYVPKDGISISREKELIDLLKSN